MRVINFFANLEIFTFEDFIFNFYIYFFCFTILIFPIIIIFLAVFTIFNFFIKAIISSFFYFLGVDSFGNLEFFIPVISKIQNYYSISYNYFGDLYGSKTEDFFPPFNFSYRNLFFAHLTGWKGLWSYYCKFTRRRVSASIFEWGYTQRIPTFYYRVLRGGFRLQLVTPNIFRRVTGTSQVSPYWFYRFKPRIRRYGLVADDWDEYNFHWYVAEADHESLVMLTFFKRIRLHYMYLSAWIEKWAPTLNPKSVYPNHFLATNLASPYSYVNFPFHAFKNSYIDFFKSRSEFGFKQKLINPQLAARDLVGRRILRYVDYTQFKKKGPQFPKIDRTLPELGNQILIEKEVVFKKIIKVAHAIFQSVPYNRPGRLISSKNNYNYFHYFHFRAYNSMIEFYTFIIESLYIYPFDTQWVKIGVDIFNPTINVFSDLGFSEFDFFGIFNEYAAAEFNLFVISFIFTYFIFFFVIFKVYSFFIWLFFKSKI